MAITMSPFKIKLDPERQKQARAFYKCTNPTEKYSQEYLIYKLNFKNEQLKRTSAKISSAISDIPRVHERALQTNNGKAVMSEVINNTPTDLLKKYLSNYNELIKGIQKKARILERMAIIYDSLSVTFITSNSLC